MLALEEERGDGAQRNTTAGHVAELIIDSVARPGVKARPIAAVVLIVALVFVLYPVRRVIKGMAREKLGTAVRITLTSPPRPRVWRWLSGASLAEVVGSD